MGIALLKKVNEKMPYWMKKPFAKIIRNKLISNPIFEGTYSQLQEYDALSTSEKTNLQFQQLKSILEYANEYSDYYHRIFNECQFVPEKMESFEDIKKLPILTKQCLKEHLDEIATSDDIDAYLVTTGGTTGEPTKVWMEKDAIYKEWAFVYHYWSCFGYDYSRSKLATFRGVDLGKKYYQIDPLYSEIRCNAYLLNENTIHEYINKISQYGAEFIYGYPSIVYNFCRLASKNKIDLRNKFKAAFLVSENLYEFQETLIKKVLGCEIAMFYGHSERAVFGEKIGDYYQFNSMYGFTEIGDCHQPIVTGFINRKTPLIRYVVDDEVRPVHEMESKDCDTARADRMDFCEKYVIEGHRDCDVVYGLNGEQFRGSMLNFHGSLSELFDQFQFVQNEIGVCELHYIDTKYDEVKEKQLEESLNTRFNGALHIKLKRVEQLQNSKRGKYKMFIQNLCI